MIKNDQMMDYLGGMKMTSEIIIILFGCLVIFTAGFVQGITGFGFALIAVPLLSKWLPLQSIVPMIVVFSLLTNILVILKIKQFIEIKRIWLLILSSIIVTPLGTYILLVIPPNLLKILVGIVIVCFATAL